MKRILIVDDHPAVLEGLSHLLTTKGYMVVKSDTVKDATTKANLCMPLDLMIVDMTLSEDGDGLVLVKKLRKTGIKVPVVIYTMHEELWNMSQLMNSDIEGIVLKGEKIDELMEAVKTVCEGGKYRSHVFNERIESMKSHPCILSSRQINIINLISRGESTTDIAHKMCLTHKAIEYHRSNIMKKLRSNSMTEAIKTAVKLGIISCMTAVATTTANAQEAIAPDAVDMGLSVKWADRNLGASTAMEAGGYYAFGETEVKDYYDWDTYQHCDDADMFCQHDLGENISGTEYDAAFTTLGGGWRMPTLEEVEELLENCTTENIPAKDDAPAYTRFTASNGAYIDIAITGYMSRSKLINGNIEVEILTGSMTTEKEEEDGFVYRINTPWVMACATAKPKPLVMIAPSHLGLNIRPVYAATDEVCMSPSGNGDGEIYSIDGRLVGNSTDALPGGIYIKVDGGKVIKFIK